LDRGKITEMKGVINMNISITNNALEKLIKLEIPPQKGIRIYTSMSNG
jgi:hypothetical protein